MSARLAVLSAFLIPVACAAALLAALFTAIPALADTVFQGGSYGYDISYPQKTGPYPSPTQTPLTFGIVGVTGGHAFTYNSYLSSQYQSVTGKSLQPSLYMNLNYAIGSTARGNTGSCSSGDKACQAYNYGYNAAEYAFSYAGTQGATASTWWLDIETANSWSAKPALNAKVIQGAIDYLSAQDYSTTTTQKVAVGIYSNAATWKNIAGSYAPGLPNWVYGAPSPSAMSTYCGPTYAFGGGTVAVVQYWNGSYDLDYACP